MYLVHLSLYTIYERIICVMTNLYRTHLPNHISRHALLGDPEVTANIYCKPRNLPNTDAQNLHYRFAVASGSPSLFCSGYCLRQRCRARRTVWTLLRLHGMLRVLHLWQLKGTRLDRFPVFCLALMCLLLKIKINESEFVP